MEETANNDLKEKNVLQLIVVKVVKHCEILSTTDFALRTDVLWGINYISVKKRKMKSHHGFLGKANVKGKHGKEGKLAFFHLQPKSQFQEVWLFTR